MGVGLCDQYTPQLKFPGKFSCKSLANSTLHYENEFQLTTGPQCVLYFTVTDFQAATMSGLKKWNHRRRYPSTCMNPSSGITGSANVGACSNKNSQPDDPFEMLQELISDGSLIKEAVRRLQLGLTPKFSTSKEFYDSDEDCRTPPAFPDICCEVEGM